MDHIQDHIQKMKNGSYRDFNILYEIFAPQLYAFIFDLTRSVSRTKDILQETFIKVWLKRTEIDETLSFRLYLFKIAKNHLIDEVRRQYRDPIFIDYLHLCANDELGENDIEQKLDFDEFNQQLMKAKEKLTPRQKEIFELNKEQGISVSEIARLLAITEQVVRNQLSAALGTLRKEMKNFTLLFILIFMS